MARQTSIDVTVEFNTSGAPTGNLYVRGSKYTYTASTLSFAIQGYGISNSPISDAPFCLVSFNAFYDPTVGLTSIDLQLPNGTIANLTLTLAAGQPAGSS